MSNGSDFRADRPTETGQGQGTQTQEFEPLAEYLAEVYTAFRSCKTIPPPPPNLPIPRVPGRDILFRTIDAIGQSIKSHHFHEFLGSFMYANVSAGKILHDAIKSRLGSRGAYFFGPKEIAQSHRLRAKRYGYPMPVGLQYGGSGWKKADVERVRDTLHYDDAATKAYDHYVPSAEFTRKPPEPISSRADGKAKAGRPDQHNKNENVILIRGGNPKPAKAARAAKLDGKPKPAKATKAKAGPKPGKAARAAKPDGKAEPKPAKAAVPFAKLFGWIGKLKISSTAKLVLAEVINHSQGCPFTWVGNKALAESVGKSSRQIPRILKSLEAAGHVTVRTYGGTWCKTQRLIFVNRLAESAGIDPKAVGLPEGRKEFWIFRARFNGQDKPTKPKRMATAKD